MIGRKRHASEVFCEGCEVGKITETTETRERDHEPCESYEPCESGEPHDEGDFSDHSLDSDGREIDYPDDDEDDEDDYSDSSHSDSSHHSYHSHYSQYSHDDNYEDPDDSEYSNDSEDIDDDPGPAPFRSSGTCCVCCNDGYGLRGDGYGSLLDIAAIWKWQKAFPSLTTSNDDFSIVKWRSETLVGSPCGRKGHEVCIGCLTKIVTDPEILLNQLVSGNGYIPCQYPHDISGFCKNALGQRNSFASYLVEYIGVSTDHAKKFYETTNSVQKYLTTRERIIGGVTDAYNHYAIPANTVQQQGRVFPGMLYHEEIKATDIAKQIQDILTCDIPNVQCKQCGVVLQRSSACNSLMHCRVNICDICGRSDIGLGEELSHWKSSNNPYGCPRFTDDDIFLQSLGYVCQELKCYDETYTCTKPEHEQSKKVLNVYRKQKQISGLWQSLSETIQTETKELLGPTIWASIQEFID